MIIQGVTLTNISVTDGSFNSNGALLYVDAGNSASYPGSGSTWTDLSSNANNVTLNGSPTYSSQYCGSIAFNGTTSQWGNTTAGKFNKTYTGKTVLLAVRMNASAWTNGVDQYRCLFGTNSDVSLRNFNLYIHHDSSNNYQLHYSARSLGGMSSNLSIATNQWFVVAATHTTGGVLTYYLNGQQVGSAQTGITFYQYVSNGGEFVGAGDNYWYGDIAVCAVYGKALSSDEISQNYKSIKDRFDTLQLYYDPSNLDSYTGSGTSISNLVNIPIKLTGTLTNITYTKPYLTFNGTNATMSVADNALLEPGSGDFSLEAWVYYSVITGSSRCIISKTNGGNAADWSYGLRTQTTGLTYMEVGNGSTSITSPTYTVTTGQWYQIVGVWTNVGSKSIALYVNGVSQGSNSHSFSSVKDSTHAMYFGSFDGGATFGQWFNGRLGVVRYYSKALTGSEVSANFQATKATYGL